MWTQVDARWMEVVESGLKWMKVDTNICGAAWIFTYILNFEIISASVYWFTHSFGFRIVKIIRLVSLAAGKYEQTGTAESRGGAARLTAAGCCRRRVSCQPLPHQSWKNIPPSSSPLWSRDGKIYTLFLTRVGNICRPDQEGGSLFSNRLTWTPYVLCFWFQLILESWCSKVNDELVQLWALFRMFDSSN